MKIRNMAFIYNSSGAGQHDISVPDWNEVPVAIIRVSQQNMVLLHKRTRFHLTFWLPDCSDLSLNYFALTFHCFMSNSGYYEIKEMQEVPETFYKLLPKHRRLPKHMIMGHGIAPSFYIVTTDNE